MDDKGKRMNNHCIHCSANYGGLCTCMQYAAQQQQINLSDFFNMQRDISHNVSVTESSSTPKPNKKLLLLGE